MGSSGKISLEINSSHLERHASKELEIKLRLPPAESGKDRVTLSLYLFLPVGLRINAKTYPATHLYDDVLYYIRFTTPGMSLDEILDPENKASPLYRIRNGQGSVLYEMRMLAAMIKTALRTIKEVFSDPDASRMHMHLVTSLERFQAERNSLMEDLARHAGTDTDAAEGCRNAAEYMSLIIQDELTAVLSEGKVDAPWYDRIVRLVETEQDWRHASGSRLLRSREGDNEEYTRIEGQLKKFVQSVLYLELDNRNDRDRTLQVLYGIAAGTAMFASLVIGYFINSLFSQNTAGFLLAVVVAYILKDRIKDAIKALSQRAVGLYIPGRKIAVRDPGMPRNPVIGKIYETARYADRDLLPREIASARKGDTPTADDGASRLESILHYHKVIRMFPERIGRYHTRRKSLDDIIRINLRSLIEQADDPSRQEPWWDREKRKIVTVKCAKVYHINTIVSIHVHRENGDDEHILKKIRIVINQKGIRRIEAV